LKTDKLHIHEENTQIFWGLISIVAIGMATYMLANAFLAGTWSIAGYKQIISIALFSIGFYGIIRISSPLFHFVLSVSGSVLSIETRKGEETPLHTQKLDLKMISALRIAPHTPRSSNEALFDFSTGYHLLYQKRKSAAWNRLIDPKDESFTLKVEDIRRIVQFLNRHQSDIDVPEEQSFFLAE
jgi:hypothetical protein